MRDPAPSTHAVSVRGGRVPCVRAARCPVGAAGLMRRRLIPPNVRNGEVGKAVGTAQGEEDVLSSAVLACRIVAVPPRFSATAIPESAFPTSTGRVWKLRSFATEATDAPIVRTDEVGKEGGRRYAGADVPREVGKAVGCRYGGADVPREVGKAVGCRYGGADVSREVEKAVGCRHGEADVCLMRPGMQPGAATTRCLSGTSFPERSRKTIGTSPVGRPKRHGARPVSDRAFFVATDAKRGSCIGYNSLTQRYTSMGPIRPPQGADGA
jgi:hypothetical protein